MQWNLIYRDENAMDALAQDIPYSAIASKKLSLDKHQNILFLEIQKA